MGFDHYECFYCIEDSVDYEQVEEMLTSHIVTDAYQFIWPYFLQLFHN